ncbi:putative mediator of RNA polymerase II transcription subunit 22 isoform X2 [Apostichopus japonicus]|uniref:Mediator of RNA polymerase II transcription subunit 22 n=1 Tax=Stichopus japonicus TaxID=307972 RepID=A0A2G8KCV1_STIJA|nr:putative mediator of RNA polymerase II transcription subunit 22 isoform X2 [Apostichopus japonicus]
MAQSQQQQRALPQSKETLLKNYQRRLKQDTRCMLDNFLEILKIAKVNPDGKILTRQLQAEEDQYEMNVRAANIVRAGESLQKLVSDIKQFLILNDFPAANEYIDDRTRFLQSHQKEVDNRLANLRDEVSVDLYEIEEEYYASKYK